MNRILKYGRYQLKAKGRHGTHSPFVYAFVEEVLRSKKRFIVRAKELNAFSGILSQRELNLLMRTLEFLQPTGLQLPSSIYQKFPISPDWLPNCIDMTAWSELEPLSSSDLLVLDGSVHQYDQILLSEKNIFTAFDRCLFIQPHQDVAAEELWLRLCSRPDVTISMDYWHFGLLIRDEGFKAKQHFYLR